MLATPKWFLWLPFVLADEYDDDDDDQDEVRQRRAC